MAKSSGDMECHVRSEGAWCILNGEQIMVSKKYFHFYFNRFQSFFFIVNGLQIECRNLIMDRILS